MTENKTKNAEKQARFRERRKEKLSKMDELIILVERLLVEIKSRGKK